MSFSSKALNSVSLMKLNDRATKSEEQDQTARMRGLILLYTLRKIKSRKSRSMVKHRSCDASEADIPFRYFLAT